jgi:hypothetical protein
VLLVTGHTSDFEEIAATSFPVLSKPFSPKQLCHQVSALMQDKPLAPPPDVRVDQA